VGTITTSDGTEIYFKDWGHADTINADLLEFIKS
jgi:hypothetical protein